MDTEEEKLIKGEGEVFSPTKQAGEAKKASHDKTRADEEDGCPYSQFDDVTNCYGRH